MNTASGLVSRFIHYHGRWSNPIASGLVLAFRSGLEGKHLVGLRNIFSVVSWSPWSTGGLWSFHETWPVPSSCLLRQILHHWSWPRLARTTSSAVAAICDRVHSMNEKWSFGGFDRSTRHATFGSCWTWCTVANDDTIRVCRWGTGVCLRRFLQFLTIFSIVPASSFLFFRISTGDGSE